MKFTEEIFREILDIGIALTTEKDHNRLFEMIIEKAMVVTNCDAGTLYLYKADKLYFKIMRTISLQIYKGGQGEEIELPPVPLQEGNVCAYSAIHKQVVNIADVYHSDKFDFAGPKNYDAMTGYRTQSMMVIPLENHENQLIGVLQLINACEKDTNEVIPFDGSFEQIILSLASQAAVAVSNMIYLEEIKTLLYSVVSAFATAVDERTPYNGSHTRNVTKYTREFIDYLNEQYQQGLYEEIFNENRTEQIILAANLHDIGKLVVPLEVMNKATRLDVHLQTVLDRFELLRTYWELDYHKGKVSKEVSDSEQMYLAESVELLMKVDSAGFLPDDLEAKIRDLGIHSYTKEDDTQIPYLTSYELTSLLVKRGTLTDEERQIMESHVVMTQKILDNIKFSKTHENVPRWASAHHECLNGTGYPRHLTEEDMPAEMRIISLIDVYDALTATDRPYKKPMPSEKALEILQAMVREGKLDHNLVNLFGDYARERL